MRPLALVLPLALVACVEGEAPPNPGVILPEPPAGACAAPDLQYLVGQPESVLQTMKFGGDTRIIRPGMAVTMDYREDRLNIEIDAVGTISRVTCG
ncbi:MAG: hypothetical protein E6Q73_07930 [Pseudorhodobacter sp.]|nr:MAG: hypothetical protein E6Q73_07930 [Pseudorhodobacter sp.]